MTTDDLWGLEPDRVVSVLLADKRWYHCDRGQFKVVVRQPTMAAPQAHFVLTEEDDIVTVGPLSSVLAVRDG